LAQVVFPCPSGGRGDPARARARAALRGQGRAMGTSDIAVERVQALLKVDTSGGSLYEHLVRVVQKLGEEPAGALAQLETLSRHLKQSNFRGEPAPDDSKPVNVDAASEALRQLFSANSLKLVRPPPSDPKTVLATVQNFMEDAAMFEWAGVGFGRQESYHLAMSLRRLAMDTPALEELRIWGKVMGTEGDYYVAEGVLQAPGDVPPPPPFVLPSAPEHDVEPRGQGPNTYTYWVAQDAVSPWVRLPAARASHIAAARNIQKFMTGNLENAVLSTPWFPGEERHLLRAQIARITSGCKLATAGWFEKVEDAEPPVPKGTIKMVDEPLEAFPGLDAIGTQEAWVHAAPFLLPNGRSQWPDLSLVESAVSENQLPPGVQVTEKELADWMEAKEKDEEVAPDLILAGIDNDLAARKADDGDPTPAWSIRSCGDKGKYTNDKDEEVMHSVVAVRSLIWPGAVAVAQGKRFANLYVGYGLKCGMMVPPDKESGLPLPLDGACPFMPLVPGEIQEEPNDLIEKEEPNPEEDTKESEAGSHDGD